MNTITSIAPRTFLIIKEWEGGGGEERRMWEMKNINRREKCLIQYYKTMTFLGVSYHSSSMCQYLANAFSIGYWSPGESIINYAYFMLQHRGRL